VILFYVVYRVFLLSLTKSILEKKRKRAVFHKLIITFLINEGRFGSKKRQISREREKRAQKKTTKKEDFFLLPFFMSFFRAFLCF